MPKTKPFILAVMAVLAVVVALPELNAKTKAGDDLRIRQKLKTLILPRIAFEDTPVSTVFSYLKQRSRQIDPEGIGVNFVLIMKQAEKKVVEKKSAKKKDAVKKDDEGFGDDDELFDEEKDEDAFKPVLNKSQEPTVTLDFNNLPLGDAVRYICSIAGMRHKVENHAVVILGPGVTQSDLELRVFSVDPRMFRNIKDEDIKRFFEEKGVSFPTTTKR